MGMLLSIVDLLRTVVPGPGLRTPFDPVKIARALVAGIDRVVEVVIDYRNAGGQSHPQDIADPKKSIIILQHQALLDYPLQLRVATIKAVDSLPLVP